MQTRARLDRMLAHGTTTAEAKTGYGLETAAELKMLDAIARLDAEHPIDLVPTFLGAHAIPAEYKGREDAYTDLVVNEMLPAVASRVSRPASFFVDVFCEDGAFTLEQSRRILEKAKELGFALKIHVDEFEPLGGTRLGVELGAISVDHVVTTPPDEIELLGQQQHHRREFARHAVWPGAARLHSGQSDSGGGRGAGAGDRPQSRHDVE